MINAIRDKELNYEFYTKNILIIEEKKRVLPDK